ncbi:hypothetical protein BKA62DRAFT_618931 [Auriculariales sp. MPI-PUGE-AT-0066]|nr:hypothetical protein BKA62DRAFT_618931 [Auriculariales sp. MPI-PUGE-AT-0066]
MASQHDQVVLDRPAGSMRTTVLPSLSDILTVQSKLSIFHSYLREVRDIHQRVSGSGSNSTLLAPTNKAVMQLPRKPHLPPDDNTENMPEISDMAFHQASQEAVNRWISAHIIPESPIAFSSTHETLLSGVRIEFHKVNKHGDDSDPKEFEVVVNGKKSRIVDVYEAHNGVLYVIEGTIPVY